MSDGYTANTSEFNDFGVYQRQVADQALSLIKQKKTLDPYNRLVIWFNLYFQRRDEDNLAVQLIADSPLRLVFPSEFEYVPPIEFIDGLAKTTLRGLLRRVEEQRIEVESRSEPKTAIFGLKKSGGGDEAHFWSFVADYLQAKISYTDFLRSNRVNDDEGCMLEVCELTEGASPEELPELGGQLDAMLAAPECPAGAARVYGLARVICWERVCGRALEEYTAANYKAAPAVPSFVDDEAEALRRELNPDYAAALSEEEQKEAQGFSPDYELTEADMAEAMAATRDALDEDEELYSDEIVDYYKSGNDRINQMQQVSRLVKPRRYCKVRFGYIWNAYNRAKFDLKTNPPPKHVLGYEFKLFYPLLARTLKDPSKIFRVEDSEKGASDKYCKLIFAPGPPYVDVAYKIVNQRWDRRKGCVRCEFDDKGWFKLCFRFQSSNFRR